MGLKLQKRWFAIAPVALITFIAAVELLPRAAADQLKPFTSDGCSSFPDGTLKEQQLWLNCCMAHDFAYWQGGNYQQRLDADKALKECVANVGKPEIAQLMLAGVRVGGSPYWPTKFRWGYGWSWPRGYKEVTKEEQRQIEEMIGE
jgi:hypothetical protein